MTGEQTARWEEVKRGFARLQALGGGGDDPVGRVVGQLGLRSQQLGELAMVASASQNLAEAEDADPTLVWSERLDGLQKTLEQLAATAVAAPEIVLPKEQAGTGPALRETLDRGFGLLS